MVPDLLSMRIEKGSALPGKQSPCRGLGGAAGVNNYRGLLGGAALAAGYACVKLAHSTLAL